MSRYIILIDMRSDNLGVKTIKDCNSNITILDDIANAKTICDTHSVCNKYPCEIIDLDNLGWCD